MLAASKTVSWLFIAATITISAFASVDIGNNFQGEEETLNNYRAEDAVVPEGSPAEELADKSVMPWQRQRQNVWDADHAMLKTEDKIMYQALMNSIGEEGSQQWARYLRHKGLNDASPEGHSWEKEGRGTVQAKLVETDERAKHLCDAKVTQHHGYFKLNGGINKNYFYWMFEARNNPETAPLIMWLTGGPGCSSEIALFTENGPCTVNQDGTSTSPNPNSWTDHANVMYIDQPAKTGYSYGDDLDIDSNEHEVSNDLYHFMQEFVKKYPQYHKNPFFIFGESYAGHFVPATGAKLLEMNLKGSGEYIPLKGIAIGNGQTDPEIQYQYYPEMAYRAWFMSPQGQVPKAVSEHTYKSMKAAVPKCVSQIKACQKDSSVCTEAFSNCNYHLISPVQLTGIDVYNLQKPCGEHQLCADYSHVTHYLNTDRVKNYLGVKKDWATCNMNINGMFATDWMKNMAGHVPPLLKNGMRVMIYAGDLDFICNWLGNKAWTLKLDWPGKDAFVAASDDAWKVNGETVGWERKHENFSFVRIHKAGHMVPGDQPKVAHMMAKTFLGGQYLVPLPAAQQQEVQQQNNIADTELA